jgi:uncharacterized protein (DUF1697 family)
MADLRAMAGELGCAHVRSLLQSGNLVFESPNRSAAALESLLEAETAKRLRVDADYLIRTAAEWQAIIDANPFPKEAANDPARLLVMLLKQAPATSDVLALEAAIRGPERIRASGRQLYAVYPAGIGRSKLTGTLIESKLGTRGTARNWNTVQKLAAVITESD